MARRRKGRDVNGVLIVNKSAGQTSNALLQRVKRMFNATKAGHTGSLDPLATGVLPICLGEATKFSQYLLDADKAYRVVGQLGAQTTTGDAEGELVNRCEVAVTQAQLEQVLQGFIGEIEQVPSMYSALKYQGKPLYKFARKGIELDRPARIVNIHELHLNGFDGSHFDISVRCSKGTYMRNLVEDIGFALDNLAFVTQLHRTQSGVFKEKDAISVEQLASLMDNGGHSALDKQLLPVAYSVSDLAKVVVSQTMAQRLCSGQMATALSIDHAEPGLVQLFDESEKFLGVGELFDDGHLAPRRLMKTE